MYNLRRVNVCKGAYRIPSESESESETSIKRRKIKDKNDAKRKTIIKTTVTGAHIRSPGECYVNYQHKYKYGSSNSNVWVVGNSIVIGQIKTYDVSKQKYTPFKDIIMHNNDYTCYINGVNTGNHVKIKLKRGGEVNFYKKIMNKETRLRVTKQCLYCNCHRQYAISVGPYRFTEPRVHVLFSSKAIKTSTTKKDTSKSTISGPGYIYHGVKMKAEPISNVPQIKQLSDQIASFFCFNEWNIGVHLIVYRDYSDGIRWHADDNQGEKLFFSVILEYPIKEKDIYYNNTSRPLLIRPQYKKGETPENGDEYIKLFACQGDVYSMNGIMQKGYQHSVPQQDKKHNCIYSRRRTILIFRHGESVNVYDYSGVSLSDAQTLVDVGRGSNKNNDNNMDDTDIEGMGIIPILSPRIREKKYMHGNITFGKFYSRGGLVS